MKYIKKFENNNKNDYIGKFFITPHFNHDKWGKEDFYISLVTDVEFNCRGKIWPISDTFIILKDGKIGEASGWGHQYTEKEFNEIYFMSPIDLYNKYPKECEKIYFKILEDENKCAEWYCRMIKRYKNALKTIPEFQSIIYANKYNL